LDIDYDGQCALGPRLSHLGVDWQRNDRLGWGYGQRPRSEHRRNLLRAIWSNFHAHAHTHTHGNGNRYTYPNTNANSHCDTESNFNADAYGYTYANGHTHTHTYTHTYAHAHANTYGYAQRFPRYSGKHLCAFARGDGR
jgi:hypothetical protein